MASKLGELVLGPMRLVTVYSAREALDKTEDRGGSRHLGYFLAMSKLSDEDLQALGLVR